MHQALNNSNYLLLEKFLSNVRKTKTCWIWIGRTATHRGETRGRFHFRKKEQRAHRVAFELLKGPIPSGLCVLHSCDNPICVNPRHLFLGTQRDNMLDAYKKKRKSNKGVKNPRVKLTPQQVREIRKRYPYESGTILAREFGLERSQPYRIYHRITWDHLK